MKRIFLLIFIFVTLIFKSQNYHFADHSGPSGTFGMIGLNNTSFYLEKRTVLYMGCLDIVTLVGRDIKGQELFRKDLDTGAFLNDAVLTILPDSNLLVASGTTNAGCDSGGDVFKLIKVDTNGNIIWLKVVYDPIKEIHVLPDGTFLVFDGTGSTWYDQNGDMIVSLSGLLGVAKINGACNYYNNHLLLNLTDQGDQFILLDSALNIKQTKFAGGVYSKMEVMSDSGLLAFSAPWLQKYSKNLVAQYSTLYSIPGYSVSAFTHRNDSVFVTGMTDSNKVYYAILNKQLQPLFVSYSNIENTNGTGIQVTGGKVNLIVHGSIGKEESYSFSGYFQAPFNESLIGKYNIGVAGIRNIQYTTVAVYKYWGFAHCIYSISADVIIKNFGVDTVYSFRLNQFSRDFYPTGYRYLGLNRYYQVTILPGDSTKVSTGVFETRFVTSGSQGFIRDNICFHTSVPDNTMDIENSNDEGCVSVGLAVGLKESDKESLVSIFPNPSNGGFTIIGPDIITNVQLIDISGRKVFEQKNNSESLFIPANIVGPGLYFVKYDTEHGNGIVKIIVEN